LTKHLKILVTDDDAELLLLTTGILQRAGHDVLTASTGEECVRKTRKHRPDLILMDVMLPGISGIEALAEIRRDPELAGTFIILLSGIQVSSDRQTVGLNVGADGYIVKPIPNKELLARVQAVERIKRAEDALKESERRYREFADLLPQTVAEFDENCNFTFVNSNGLQTFGYTKKDLEQGLNLFQTVAPEDHSRMKENIERLYRGDKTGGNAYLMVRKDGSKLHALIHATPIVREDGIAGIRSIVIDITDRKRVEDELRASEEKYRRLFDDAVLGVFQSTLDGRIITNNLAHAKMFGYSSPEELVSTITDVAVGLYADPSRRPSVIKIIEEAKGPVQVENLYRRKDGSTFVGNLHAWIATDSGGQPVLEGFVEDISDRRRSEELLRESDRISRATIDALSANLCVLDEQGQVLNVNRAWKKFADENPPAPPGYCVGMNYLTVCDNAEGANSAEAGPFAEGIRSVMAGSAAEFSLEYPCHSSETERWFMGRVTRFPGEGLLRLVITHEEITTRKLAEEKLRENKYRLDLALQSARMGTWYWDMLDNRRHFDDQCCRLLGIDPAHFGGSPDEFFASIHPDDREKIRTALASAVERDEPYEPYYRAIWPDGTIHHIAARGRLVRDADGRAVKIYGIIWDVTSRKIAEEAMQASLREKEVLLKEIHHRVKNNLQVMSSLLNLQSQHLTDPKALDALRVSMHRIKTMALIHDKLYRSESLSGIYFPGYVRDLMGDLINTYAPDKHIALNMNIDPVSFDLDTSIPLGLILNELVSNSLKHAFPDGEGGAIAINLHSRNASVEMAVSDTGIGFPEDLDFMDTKSMGMQLVVILVDQLEGTIDLKRSNGTEFIITFPAAV